MNKKCAQDDFGRYHHYETFDTHYEAEDYANRMVLTDYQIKWSEKWYCWIVLFND